MIAVDFPDRPKIYDSIIGEHVEWVLRLYFGFGLDHQIILFGVVVGISVVGTAIVGRLIVGAFIVGGVNYPVDFARQCLRIGSSSMTKGTSSTKACSLYLQSGTSQKI